jgi:manganese/iron transport system substrate-binding protein
MSYRSGPALVIAVALVLAACGGDAKGVVESGRGPVRVAASTSVFADMVRQVGGDRVTVLTLIPPGADAHTFQPAPRDVQKLGGVRAAFINGHGLEEALMGVLTNNLPKEARLVELSAGLPAIAFEGEPVGPAGADGDHEEEEGGNPHFWLDLAYAKRYVERIRDALTAIDPEGQAIYQANADRYLAQLDDLDREIRATIAAIPPEQRKLVTFHDAFPYFARAYGLELVAYVVRAPGREPSAQEIKALGEALRQHRVKTVFKEPQFNARLLERAAQDAGVKVDVLYSDTLTGDIKTFVDMMRRNADNIARGLK